MGSSLGFKALLGLVDPPAPDTILIVHTTFGVLEQGDVIQVVSAISQWETNKRMAAYIQYTAKNKFEAYPNSCHLHTLLECTKPIARKAAELLLAGRGITLYTLDEKGRVVIPPKEEKSEASDPKEKAQESTP